MLNQREFRNWRFATLALIKAVANGHDLTLAFCDETETLYKWDSTSGATADDKFVLTTGAGGNTRWIGIAGKYCCPASGKPFGEMYLTATAAVAVAQDPTYTELGGTTALGDKTEFDMPANNQLRYTGVETKKFKIVASVSASSSGSDTYLFRLAKTGTTIAKSNIPRYMSGINDTGAMPLSCITDLAQNDYVGVWCARSSIPARNIIMQGLNLVAEAIN